MQRKLERTAVLLVLVASPFWLPAVSSRLSATFRMPLMEGISPVLRVLEDLRGSFRDLGLGVLRGPILLSENKVLRDQIDLLVAHEEIHQALAQENARLKALLKFKEQSPWEMIPAQVIGRDYSIWSRGILIDKGSQDQIRLGQAVLTPVGLLGRVIEVGSHVSRVILVTDPRFRVSAVLSRLRVAGLVMGSGSGECQITYLPSNVELKDGETVVTAGGLSFCPEGIPIGIIRRVSQSLSELYRLALIRPAVKLSSVEEVLVVRWSGSDSAS